MPDQSTQQGIAFQPGPIKVSEGSVGEVGGRKARYKKDKAWNIATFKIFVSSCEGGRKPQKTNPNQHQEPTHDRRREEGGRGYPERKRSRKAKKELGERREKV